MRVPARMMPHGGLVTYRAKVGEATYGPQFLAEVVPTRATIDDEQKLFRTSDSREITSSARVILDPEHVLPLGSEVTIWKGRPNERTTTVLAVAVADFPRLPHFVRLVLE